MSSAATYTALIPKPHPDSVNGGHSPLHQATVLRVFGEPAVKTQMVINGGEVDIQNLTPKLRKMIVTESVGPFRVTGHKAAVASLKDVFKTVLRDHPDLYHLLSSAGMIVVRLVRGSKSSWSNHSFGFALDIKIAGKLDARGDDKVQAGMLILYSVFKRFGWYWGVEFSTEDAMHFEVSDELFRWMESEGLLLAA